MFGFEKYGIEKYGIERYGIERYGIAGHGMTWYGMNITTFYLVSKLKYLKKKACALCYALIICSVMHYLALLLVALALIIINTGLYHGFCTG